MVAGRHLPLLFWFFIDINSAICRFCTPFGRLDCGTFATSFQCSYIFASKVTKATRKIDFWSLNADLLPNGWISIFQGESDQSMWAMFFAKL